LIVGIVACIVWEETRALSTPIFEPLNGKVRMETVT